MKKPLTILFLVLFHLGYGQITNNLQENKTDNKSTDTTILKINSLEEKVDKLLSIVKKNKDSTLKIGSIFLLNSKIIYKQKINKNSFKECEKTKTLESGTSQIEKIHISIDNGVINSIFIYTNDGMTFSNGFAPIDLDRINKGTDILSFKKGDVYCYVQLNSVIKYEMLENYYAEDDFIVLTPKNKSKDVYKNSGINSLINVRLYSDILGLLGETNGIAQTELFFSIPIHRNNINNKYLYFLSDFSTKLQLSRLDEKYQYTNIDTDNSFSRITFNQRKWLNFEMAVSFLSGNLQKKSMNKFRVDLISGLNISRFGDTIKSTNYTLPYFGFIPSIHLKSSKNFGIDFSTKFSWEMFPEKQSETYGGTLIYFTPELELFFNPLNNPGSKIFARINYSTLTQTRGSFWNFQFGYNISISELINKKKD